MQSQLEMLTHIKIKSGMSTILHWLNTEQTYIDTILIQSKAGIIIGIKPHHDINSLFPLEQTRTFLAS